MGLEHIENEEYTQHERDLYAKIHENLNSCLNNNPFNYPDMEVNTNIHSLNLSISNLEVQLKQIPSLKSNINSTWHSTGKGESWAYDSGINPPMLHLNL